jgi:hypothetical protein
VLVRLAMLRHLLVLGILVIGAFELLDGDREPYRYVPSPTVDRGIRTNGVHLW